MAVTSKELRTSRARGQRGFLLWSSLSPVAYAVTFVLAALALYVIISTMVAWGQERLDDIRYGRPRTTHLVGLVGHEGKQGQPTHFIAMNLDRQVVVLELPGGDASKVRSLPGPYLFGAGEDLTPVMLELQDVDKDGYNDLVMIIRNEQVVYLNRDASFRLPTPEEQRQLVQEQGQ